VRYINLPPARPDEHELLRAALLKLPLAAGKRDEVDRLVQDVCALLSDLRLQFTTYPDDWTVRKPEAAVVTVLAAAAYLFLTESIPTRLCKPVKGSLGVKEAALFAKFLDDVFAAAGIQASGAGQAKMLDRDVMSGFIWRSKFHRP
jgi:hypothetical protein